MDTIDDVLRTHFRPEAPAGLAARLQRGLIRPPRPLVELAERLDIEATAEGVTHVTLRRRGERGRVQGGAHAERAHAELREFLGGQRAFFSVPADLSALGVFQQRVLAEAQRIPFGEVTSYARLAARVGQPRAARAVGNALATNPVPLIVPCHRVIRGDGTWGRYGLGDPLKTELLGLERATPTLVGCTTTRIVCRRGCRHEQRVGEDRRIVFASVPDAVSVGYRPCRVCRPAAA
jgi:O-6-methylguanine DNA methyltransferase